MVQYQSGNTEYVFRCETKIDRNRWVKALRNELTENPLLDTLADRRAQARGERGVEERRMSSGPKSSIILNWMIKLVKLSVFENGRQSCATQDTNA